MKFLKPILLLAIMGINSACNKEYTCTCTDDQTGEVTNISTYDLSQSNAESACNNAASVGITCILDQK